MSKSLTLFFWISSFFFSLIGLASLISSLSESFRIIPLATLTFGLILLIYTYISSLQTIEKKYEKLFKILSVLIYWLISIIFIFIISEQYLRFRNGFNLIDLSLKTHLVTERVYEQNNFWQIFNSSYLDYLDQNNLDTYNYNENTFNPVDEFGVETDSPPYLFMKNRSYSYENGIFKLHEGNKKVHFKTNSNGFRGPEIDLGKKITILCLGASTTEGTNSDENNTYPVHLQTLIEKENQDIQVLNLGHSGYKPEDIYNLLKFNLNLNPDIVIYFEGNGNGLNRKEVYSDEGFSASKIFHNIYKRTMLGRIIISSIPETVQSIYLNRETESFDLNQKRPSKKEYFTQVEKIIDLSLKNNIVPLLVSPVNGWDKNILFSNEEFLNMQKELNDYWPLTPKEIELFYIDYAKKYKELAGQKKVTLINVENKFKGNKDLFLNAENTLTDLHHLSPTGNKKLAELIYQELKLIIENLQ